MVKNSIIEIKHNRAFSNMNKRYLHRIFYSLILAFGLSINSVSGVVALGSPNPEQSASTGLQGRISAPPPSDPATIVIPSNGQVFNDNPIEVSGLCTTDLLVKVYNNGVFVGSAPCVLGSYTMQVDLFKGTNTLVSKVYDDLDQEGPESNKVTVTLEDPQYAGFGQRISLTSSMAKAGANVGSKLTWPIAVAGGTSPYAISVDWGDGSAQTLKSVEFPGEFEVSHTYKAAGIYHVVVKATDKDGYSAFLQLVGVGNGEVAQQKDTVTAEIIRIRYIWWPVLLLIPFSLIAFWIGKRYELVAIHRELEKQVSDYSSDVK